MAATLTGEPSASDGAAQAVALGAVLNRVAATAARGLKPVVQIDLDLTALMPCRRTRLALAAAAAHFPVPEWAEDQPPPPLLPGYTDEAWAEYLRVTGLPDRFPDWVWSDAKREGSVHTTFHAAYWTTAWLAEDEPTPGLGEFVRRVEDRGGVAVFLSGRWRVEQAPPSRAALRRAGIADPLLLIGNHRHERNVLPARGEQAWSDGRVKARAQAEIRERFGVPVAVFDDRSANRRAVVEANAEYLREAGLPDVLRVAVAVPGFTHAADTSEADGQVTTFESGRPAGPDPRREPFLAARYPLPATEYLGLFAGVGRNGRGYVLPRHSDPSRAADIAAGFDPVFADLTGRRGLTLDEFMAAAEQTIPAEEVGRLRSALDAAAAAAGDGLAESMPRCSAARRQLWQAVACSWLHARDLGVLMTALGYPAPDAGTHDLHEPVPAADVIGAVERAVESGHGYSEWFLRWVARLDRRGVADVGLLNPHLVVSAWRWKEGAGSPQDAMDAHRTSAHHEGDGHGRYDPVEATANNLLHDREGRCGVQKTAVMPWPALAAALRTHADAARLAKSGWGGELLADAVPLLRALEERGAVLPWDAVAPEAP